MAESLKRLSDEELIALSEERDMLIEEVKKEYSAAFRAFLLQQNSTTKGAPEYKEAELLKEGLKGRGTLENEEINSRVERKKLDIYHKAVNNMVRLETLLGAEEAEETRRKIYLEINGDLRAKGKQPKLGWKVDKEQ